MVVVEAERPIKGTLYLDGKKKASLVNTPSYSLEDVSAGEHELEVRDGERVFKSTITVEAGKTVSVSVKFPVEARPQPETTPLPRPRPKPRPVVKPRPRPRPKPRPVVKPRPRPKPRPVVKPKPRPRPGKKPGLLMLMSKPWARVFIDGRDTGRNTPIPPSNPLSVSPGRHKLTLVSKGKKYHYKVVIRSGKYLKLVKILPTK